MNREWTTDADIVAAVDAFCAEHPELQTVRSDPRAFTRAAATLPAPQGVSPSAIEKMLEAGKEKGLTR